MDKPRLPKIREKTGPKDSGSLSSPSFNYLGHFKQMKFLKQGHNDSGKLKGVGLSDDEASKPISDEGMKALNSAFNSATGSSGVSNSLKNVKGSQASSPKSKKDY